MVHLAQGGGRPLRRKPFTSVRLVQEVAKHVPLPGTGAPPKRPTS